MPYVRTTKLFLQKLKSVTIVNTRSRSKAQHYEESTHQAHQWPPPVPKAAGDKERVASLEARVAQLAQQNKLCFRFYSDPNN